MDLTILIGIATALLVIQLILLFLQKKKENEDKKPQHQRGAPQRAQEGVPRRAQIIRNQRNRLRQNVAPAAGAAAALDNALNGENTDNNEQGEIPRGEVLDEKMGAKKRAKMEQKKQKRLMLEQELKMREEKKAKESKLEEERKKQEEREAEDERKQAEAERLAREEQERKEHEEYMKMKAAFSIEEEGFEDEEEKENLLADFVKYIQDNKVVVLEDLAAEFKLKTQHAIERIQELQANGTIIGVIDDRGKFIYISEDELSSVAKFIRQRGRVSILELVESSNNLINLTPVVNS